MGRYESVYYGEHPRYANGSVAAAERDSRFGGDPRRIPRPAGESVAFGMTHRFYYDEAHRNLAGLVDAQEFPILQGAFS